jgi:hypothetical protein
MAATIAGPGKVCEDRFCRTDHRAARQSRQVFGWKNWPMMFSSDCASLLGTATPG